MYRTIRHGIVEPVRIRPKVHLALLVIGALLIIATIGLYRLWRQAVREYSAPIICTGTNMTIDNPQSLDQPCIPNYAPPADYAHGALATSAAGVGCLIVTYVLGRRSPTK